MRQGLPSRAQAVYQAIENKLVTMRYRFWSSRYGYYCSQRSGLKEQIIEVKTGPKTSFLVANFRTCGNPIFVDIDLEIDVTWENSRHYRYSKLYYSSRLKNQFSEERVICFRIEQNRSRHWVRIKLPYSRHTLGNISLRIDLLPYCQGRAKVYGCRLADDSGSMPEMTRLAELYALKRATRTAVKRSEDQQVEKVGHYPESMSLEIQPGCNLQCGHCATHGTPEQHDKHNRLGHISTAHIQLLATEVFPHLTLLHLVGRGEPLMVSDKLWNLLVEQAHRNRLLLTVVTNGYFVKRRITEDIIPLIDTLTISIDGFSPEILATNRGGASFDTLVGAMGHFHELRKRMLLPRRPKLCISWTLKRNNIAELPAFVRFVAQFEPDRFYMRHLLVCHDKDEEQSLLREPEIVNRYLTETYALFDKMDIETDCPPLMAAAKTRGSQCEAQEVHDKNTAAPNAEPRDSICHYIHRTACLNSEGRMSTCGIYHAKAAGFMTKPGDFFELWNSDVMRGVRRDINTAAEWRQCSNCWFRQSRYHSQRKHRARGSSYALTRTSTFTKQAWDYRKPKA